MNHIVFDSECAPAIPGGGVNPNVARAYDVGFVVINDAGDLLHKYNVGIAETFGDMQVMTNAYYKSKLGKYLADMRTGDLRMRTAAQARRDLYDVCKEYSVKNIWAYNCKYDFAALNATVAAYSQGFSKYFWPYGTTVCDIAVLFGETIASTEKYVRYCRENGFMTPNGNPKTSAEVAYRYISGDSEFIEAHTALNDALIEAEILTRCFKRRKSTANSKNPKLWGTGWKAPAKLCADMRAR